MYFLLLCATDRNIIYMINVSMQSLSAIWHSQNLNIFCLQAKYYKILILINLRAILTF